MWRPLVLLLSCWALLAWGNSGFDTPSNWSQEDRSALGCFPPWLVALERIFRRGMGRLLGWGLRRAIGLPNWLWGLGLVRAGCWLISALIGPCGRLWRWCFC